MAGRPKTRLEGIALENSGKNITYLIQCVRPSLLSNFNLYKENSTFPTLATTGTVLRQAKNGKRVTEETLIQISRAFSLYLKDSEKEITPEDLQLSPAEFKEEFPAGGFKQTTNSSRLSPQSLVANKLFYGYYLLPDSPYIAYQAYFKIFYNPRTKKYCATMLRGIKNYEDFPVKCFRSCFEGTDPKQLAKCYDNLISKSGEKSSLHLYTAEDSDIQITERSIQIRFISYESKPRYCYMCWNINIIQKANLTSYDGGVALCMNSNDGRGEVICTYKLGLEAVYRKFSKKELENTRLNILSPRLLQELSGDIRNGTMVLDNSQDNRWYNYTEESSNRMDPSNSDPDLTPDIDLKKLMDTVVKLEHAYNSVLHRLENLLDEHEKK